jgi:hypothetical protein
MEQKKKKTIKPKVKPKTKSKPEKKPEKKKEKGTGKTIITIIKQQDHSVIDNFYDRKVNNIIKKIKEQNTMIDDKIRFGWNAGDAN